MRELSFNLIRNYPMWFIYTNSSYIFSWSKDTSPSFELGDITWADTYIIGRSRDIDNSTLGVVTQS